MADKKSGHHHGIVCKAKNFIFSSKNKGQEEEKIEYDYDADYGKDIARTFLLSHRNQLAEANKFIEALIRATEINFRTKEDVLSGIDNASSAEENTNALLKYMERMTGVLLLCSDDLVSLLNKPEIQETQVDIQICGEDVHLNAKLLSSGIKASDVIKQKIIILKLHGDDYSKPDNLDTSKTIFLSKSNLDRSDPNKTLHEIWVDDVIVPDLKPLMKKRLVSQSSLEA